MLCVLVKGMWEVLSELGSFANIFTSFNSYTQQICVNDAVVIDESRPENVVTNDGTTMRIMAQKNAIPSAWTRQREVIVGEQATAVLEENARKAKAEVALIEKIIDEPDEGT